MCGKAYGVSRYCRSCSFLCTGKGGAVNVVVGIAIRLAAVLITKKVAKKILKEVLIIIVKEII